MVGDVEAMSWNPIKYDTLAIAHVLGSVYLNSIGKVYTERPPPEGPTTVREFSIYLLSKCISPK